MLRYKDMILLILRLTCPLKSCYDKPIYNSSKITFASQLKLKLTG